MSDAPANQKRQCPSWCVEHFDHLDSGPRAADGFEVHTGLKSNQPLSIFGLWPLTTSLERTDSVDGEPVSYAIELHVGERSWLQLTPAEADYLAQQLHLLTAEARRMPATRQAGSLD
ncbi:DUF6907 domain-containing protein [Nocardia sp. NBC_01327]|uniref:DUF6907 domain-containing protein n=1 Tax=Nocardia sp. NBC_01327 TaxID=2903593 RepID=UPI002E14C265|nr:hypothetical protein OG326_42040 [Nocardia sp. NBC_01327]